MIFISYTHDRRLKEILASAKFNCGNSTDRYSVSWCCQMVFAFRVQTRDQFWSFLVSKGLVVLLGTTDTTYVVLWILQSLSWSSHDLVLKGKMDGPLWTRSNNGISMSMPLTTLRNVLLVQICAKSMSYPTRRERS